MKQHKIWIALAICVMFVYFLRTCSNNSLQRTVGKNEVLKEAVEKVKDGTEVNELKRLRERDSIIKENSAKEKQIKQLRDKISESDFKIADLKVQISKDKLKIKDMNLSRIADTLNSFYGGKNAIANQSDISIKSVLPNQIVETYVENEFNKNVVAEKDKQIVVFDSIVGAKDKIIYSKSILLVSAEKSVEEHKEVIKVQEEFSQGIVKENRKIKTKSVFSQILAVGVGAIAGFLIAK